MKQVTYGNSPVPWTVSWTQELEKGTVKPCPFAGGKPAFYAPEAIGMGKPAFGKMHPQRQRKAAWNGLCDICARPLKAKTKLSLSSVHPTMTNAGMRLLVHEPLCCITCAKISLQKCPHLRSQVKSGSMIIRQVFNYSTVAQVLTPDAVDLFTTSGKVDGVVGYVKISLDQYERRDLEWLEGLA
jgi:hypothetical protein